MFVYVPTWNEIKSRQWLRNTHLKSMRAHMAATIFDCLQMAGCPARRHNRLIMPNQHVSMLLLLLLQQLHNDGRLLQSIFTSTPSHTHTHTSFYLNGRCHQRDVFGEPQVEFCEAVGDDLIDSINLWCDVINIKLSCKSWYLQIHKLFSQAHCDCMTTSSTKQHEASWS